MVDLYIECFLLEIVKYLLQAFNLLVDPNLIGLIILNEPNYVRLHNKMIKIIIFGDRSIKLLLGCKSDQFAQKVK